MTTRPAMRIGGGSHRRDHRAGAEDGHSGQHDLLAAEEVTDRPETQHQPGKCQGVTVHHPLQLADRGVEFALDVCENHRDDGVVQEGQEEDEEEGRESQRSGSGHSVVDVRAVLEGRGMHGVRPWVQPYPAEAILQPEGHSGPRQTLAAPGWRTFEA